MADPRNPPSYDEVMSENRQPIRQGIFPDLMKFHHVRMMTNRCFVVCDSPSPFFYRHSSGRDRRTVRAVPSAAVSPISECSRAGDATVAKLRFHAEQRSESSAPAGCCCATGSSNRCRRWSQHDSDHGGHSAGNYRRRWMSGLPNWDVGGRFHLLWNLLCDLFLPRGHPVLSGDEEPPVFKLWGTVLSKDAR